MFSVAPILSMDQPADGSATLGHRLEKLRSISGVLKSPPPSRGALPWKQATVPVPRGALTEVSGPTGSGKTEALLKFIATHQHELGRVAWIEDRFTAYPTGFLQHGIDLRPREVGRDLVRALEADDVVAAEAAPLADQVLPFFDHCFNYMPVA